MVAFKLQAVELAAQSVPTETFDQLVAALTKSRGINANALAHDLETVSNPRAVLAAAASWLRRVIAQNGAPSAGEERGFMEVLKCFVDEDVAPWAALEVFQAFPAKSFLRFFTQLFDVRVAAPLCHVITLQPKLRTRQVDTWLAEVAPELSVPHYDFDRFGAQRIVLGGRSVVLRLGIGNTLSLEDESGKRLRSLPRARKADDPAVYAAGKEKIQAVRQAVKKSHKQLTRRFEDDMLLGRIWEMEAWCELFLGHPLLQPIARALVFESLDASGETRTSFFVSEEGELLDLDLEPIELGHGVRIAHPTSLEECVAWQTLFIDAEIEQPFLQLHRPCPPLPSMGHPFSSFLNRRVQAREWCRSFYDAHFNMRPQDNRRRVYKARRRYGSDFRVEIQHSGHFENIFVLNEFDTLTIENVVFYDRFDQSIPFTRVPITIVAEIRRLFALALPQKDTSSTFASANSHAA